MQKKESIFQSNSLISNIAWKFLERGSSVAVTLLVNILLARLLEPSDHGLLASLGFGVYLRFLFQKKKAEPTGR